MRTRARLRTVAHTDVHACTCPCYDNHFCATTLKKNERKKGQWRRSRKGGSGGGDDGGGGGGGGFKTGADICYILKTGPS